MKTFYIQNIFNILRDIKEDTLHLWKQEQDNIKKNIKIANRTSEIKNIMVEMGKDNRGL
jgi:hypothetical protein